MAMKAFTVATVALALLARRRNWETATGISLGLATLTKLFPIVLFPALYKRWGWKMPAALVALTTRFGLMKVITGAVVSWTRTVKLAKELLPDPSVAVTQTVVVPSPKTAPDGRE